MLQKFPKKLFIPILMSSIFVLTIIGSLGYLLTSRIIAFPSIQPTTTRSQETSNSSTNSNISLSTNNTSSFSKTISPSIPVSYSIIASTSAPASSITAPPPPVVEPKPAPEPIKPKPSLATIPVLMYHHIRKQKDIPPNNKIAEDLSVSPEALEKHLQYAEDKGYQTVTLKDLYDYTQGKFILPPKPIVFTFDDGYKDNISNALPIFQKHKQVGDFAIITGVVGTSEYMNWEDLKVLRDTKMGISSHTDLHCYSAVRNTDTRTKLAKPFQDSPINDKDGQQCPKFTYSGVLNTGEVRGEYKLSKEKLEANLGISIHSLVYPYGFYNQQSIDIAKEVGYDLAFTVDPEKNNQLDLSQPLKLPRIRIPGQQDESVKILSGL